MIFSEKKNKSTFIVSAILMRLIEMFYDDWRAASWHLRRIFAPTSSTHDKRTAANWSFSVRLDLASALGAMARARDVSPAAA